MVELPRVKVCGLTRAEDVELALAAGADALGFVHYPPSPRHVPAEELPGLIGTAAGSARAVLVVVDVPPDELAALLRASGAQLVQLCGDERPADYAGLGVPVLRRLPVGPEAGPVLAAWRDHALGFVLDHPSAPGGTGLGVGLDLARQLAAEAPCLLAGGLDGETVAERVARVRPRGVDGASRLEASPGIKDGARVRAFVERALAALACEEE